MNGARELSYEGLIRNGDGTCGPTKWSGRIVIAHRNRSLECPTGYLTRGLPNGDMECYIPPPCETCRGNPVDVGNGSKRQSDTDYRSPAPGGLEFTRYYNSAGYFSTQARDPRWNDYWRHTYDRRIVAIPGNSYLMAVAVRHDGLLQHFTPAGIEVHNFRGGANRLQKLTDTLGATTGWRYTGADNDVEVYDAQGALQSLTTRAGYAYTLSYAGTVLQSVTDSFGRSLTFTYDAKGRLATLTDPAAQAYQYAYDRYDNLVTVTYPNNTLRSYLYEDTTFRNALTGIVDENAQRYATYTYNSLYGTSQVKTSEHAGGAGKITLTYSPWGATQYSYVTDAFNTTSLYNFQRIGGVLKLTSENQSCTGCPYAPEYRTYDTNGNLASYTDKNGNKTCYSYDAQRNLELIRVEGLASAADCPTQLAAATPAAPARTLTTAWHPTYRLPTLITEPGRTTATTHDASGNVLTQTVTDTATNTSRTTTYTYNPYGQVLTSDGPRSDVTDITTYTYDTQGNVATVTNAKGHVTTIAQYDASGRPKKIIDANGLETLLDYFPRGWLKSRATGSAAAGYLTTTYTYDGVGQLKTVTLPDLSTLTYDYDPAHRLIRLTDTLGNKIDYTLDNIGNRISETSTDPQGALVKAHTRQYDALNRLFKDIGGANPLTQITTLGYDANGNPTSTTDPLARVTTQSYDALNRLTQVIDPFNGAAKPTQYTYNAQDQLTQVTDPKGLATAYTYNGLGELLTQVSPDTGITSFTYDAAGNLKTKTDARNVTAAYSYDPLNRLTTLSYPATGSDAAETVTYSYDTCTNGKGRLCTLTDKTGVTAYTYDLYGRITAKSQTVGTLTQTMSYAYNSAGQLASITTPSGKSVTYTYQNNQPVAVAVNGRAILDQGVYKPFGPVGGWRWGNSTPTTPNFHVRAYDKDYRASSVASERVGAGKLTRNYAWSDVSTLSAITDPASAANSFNYGYDSLDRLTNAVAAGATPATFGYSYDGDGNRLTQTTANPASTTTYTYPTTSNRLANLSGATAKTYQYDAVGNLTNDGTHTWSYGGNNRPTQVSNAIATTTQFQINALGQRVKKSSAGTDQRFVYDEAGRLWGEYDGSGALIAETIWFNDLPVAVLK